LKTHRKNKESKFIKKTGTYHIKIMSFCIIFDSNSIHLFMHERFLQSEAKASEKQMTSTV